MQILGRKNVKKTGKTSFFGVRRLAGTSASTGQKKMSKYNLDEIDEDKQNTRILKGRKRTWMGGEAEEEHKCKPVCAGLREPFQIGSKDGMKKFLLFM